MSVISKIDSNKKLDILIDYYVDKKWSTTKLSLNSESIFGFYISSSSIYNTLIRNNIPVRSKSESVGMAMSTLDYSAKLETDDMVEWIDGFNLGDGYISYHPSKNCLWRGARYVIGTVEREWCEYAMSKFLPYCASNPKQYGKIRDRSPRLSWSSTTLTHPDIVKQAQRWYPNGKKKIPKDVHITPTSILLWYLGDGSITKSGISYTVRFATCSFDPNDIDGILIPKMKQLGLDVWRDGCGKNDIKMATKSTSMFFDIIGKKSPISCYNYKFEFHQWLTLKRLSDVIPDKKERWRVQYMFKQGKLDCTLSPGGKMILFTPEQEEKLLVSLHKRRFHDTYEEGQVLQYKKDVNIQNGSGLISLSDIVKTSMGRWNARYLMTTERIESLKGSKFTIEQAKILREKLDQYGEKLAIPEKDINRYFDEARSWGFPYYEISKERFINGINTLKNINISKKDEIYNWVGKGSELASYFHPHMFECKSKGNMSALELFNSDEDFKRAIWKVIALYGKITKSNIREICRNEKASSRINQFPPRVAMAIIKDLFPCGGIRYMDPTHGFSGRLIGSYCSGLIDEYVGIDLSIHTHKGAMKTVEWMEGLSHMNVKLLHGNCLQLMPEIGGNFDLVMTSPPFLDVEQYKDVPFETNYIKWLDEFVFLFCKYSFEALKGGGKMAVYLEKIKGNDFRYDFINIAKKVGFIQLDSINFTMSYGENNRNNNAMRYIPILVFQK